MNYHLDNKTEQFVIDEITMFIRDSLLLLLKFNNQDMEWIRCYCNENKDNFEPIYYDELSFLANEAIYALFKSNLLKNKN